MVLFCKIVRNNPEIPRAIAYLVAGTGKTDNLEGLGTAAMRGQWSALGQVLTESLGCPEYAVYQELLDTLEDTRDYQAVMIQVELHLKWHKRILNNVVQKQKYIMEFKFFCGGN